MTEHLVPQRGDIITAPTLSGSRYVVISPETFNALGMCLVAPIVPASECRRYAGFSSPAGVNDDGHEAAILASHIQPLSLTSHTVNRLGNVAPAIVDDLLARLQTLVVPG